MKNDYAFAIFTNTNGKMELAQFDDEQARDEFIAEFDARAGYDLGSWSPVSASRASELFDLDTFDDLDRAREIPHARQTNGHAVLYIEQDGPTWTPTICSERGLDEFARDVSTLTFWQLVATKRKYDVMACEEEEAGNYYAADIYESVYQIARNELRQRRG